MISWAKQKVINYLLSNVIKVTNQNDVIREHLGVLYLGENKIGDIELQNLVAEAKALESMRLWSIINETIKQSAYERGWKKSTTIAELNTAKTEFHVLETQNSIIRIIKSKSG